MRRWAVAAGLIVLTLLVYEPVTHHPFVNFDDAQYVSQNPEVMPGLTSAGVRWAFTSGYAGNWHPLTWLSHMLDVRWFGMDAGRHHAVNLFFHIANTLLLLLLCRRLGGSLWQGAAVAALFAVHPLHVESVAWIAERKDVLSAFFWMLTLIAYVSYVRRPSVWRYLVVLIGFALGLMAKPMVVTLPFVLLLLDFWPLGRLQVAGSERPASRSIGAACLEKAPLFALALASSIVTFVVQRQAGAVKEFTSFPLGHRIANAVVAYATYLWKTIWPSRLAPLYPYDSDISLAAIAVSIVVLAGITAIAIQQAQTRRYLLTGWLMFLGMLVPVIGLVQIGSQPFADRYTYLPSIGIFIAVVWSVSDVVKPGLRAGSRFVVAATSCVVIAALAVTAHAQVNYWQDSITLWRHTVDVTAGNYRAHSNLGQALYTEHRLDDAIHEYEAALAIKPDFAETRNYLGLALADRGDLDRAVAEYRAAIMALPSFTNAHNNLGLALAEKGRFDAAIEEFAEATRLDPTFAGAWSNLGIALARSGRFEESVRAFAESLSLRPDSAETRMNLATAERDWGHALIDAGRLDDAVRIFRSALGLAPNDPDLHAELGFALAKQGQKDSAIAELRTALQLDPSHAEARRVLAELTRK